MGLAISLVAMEKEKVGSKSEMEFVETERACVLMLCLCWGDYTQVWYHVCASRGKSCNNTRLKESGGCTIWYNEKEVRTVFL